MSSMLNDSEAILSGNEHWSKLDEEWGTPIDLETDDDGFVPPSNLSFLSTLDFKKPVQTFGSAIKLRKVQEFDSYSKKPQVPVNYKDFIQALEDQDEVIVKEDQVKQFYYIGGQIFSAVSVDEICNSIDNIFRSVEKLCATTSTIRKSAKKTKKVVPRMPEVIECSFPMSDLSFDETMDNEKEKSDSDDVDRFIDELFDELNQTVLSLQKSSVREKSSDQLMDQPSIESVTTLVSKFSSFLDNPAVKCSPRRQRQCCERFRDLVEFWKSRTQHEVSE